jgi:hypothetical protein
MGVNESRRGLESNVNHAVDDAKVIGFNGQGEACVWSGGHGFNVYDAARDWQEVGHFTSGTMVDHENEEKARERMKMDGFDPI